MHGVYISKLGILIRTNFILGETLESPHAKNSTSFSFPCNRRWIYLLNVQYTVQLLDSFLTQRAEASSSRSRVRGSFTNMAMNQG